MAGTYVATEHGLVNISGGYLKTCIDAISSNVWSGQLFLLPISNSNQVAVISVVAS